MKSKRSDSINGKYPLKLWMAAVLTYIMIVSGCAGPGALRVINAPTRPLSSYRTLAFMVTPYDTLIPPVGVAEVGKIKNAIFSRLGKSGSFDGIYEFPKDAKKAQLWMQVKPVRLNTGLNYNSFIFGPRVMLEVSFFDARQRTLVAKIEADGEHTEVFGFWGPSLYVLTAALTTDSSIINAADFISNYIKAN